MSQMDSRDHIRKGYCDLIGGNLSLLVTTLPSFLVRDVVEEELVPNL